MKKRCLLLIIILLVLIPNWGFADSEIKIMIDGLQVQFNQNTGFPFIDENGRIQVPVSAVLESCGIFVVWDDQNRTVITQKDGVRVEIPIGKNYVTKNYKQIEIDTAARIKDGRTYLPIRKVMESYGGEVKWDSSIQTVFITTTKNSSILRFNLPPELGMPKLSKEEIDELVGAEPQIIQEKISTVYDFIQYMESAGYRSVSGDTHIEGKVYNWSFNRPALSTIKVNEGNCGATSNLANYILKDDYDEVGFVFFSADSGQGGHIINYIKQDEKYYVIDFVKYPMSDYKGFIDIVTVDDLKDFPEECIIRYGDRGRLYQIKIIISYQADNQIPIGYNRREVVGRFFPIDMKDSITVLYETPSEGKIVDFIKGPEKQPKWD